MFMKNQKMKLLLFFTCSMFFHASFYLAQNQSPNGGVGTPVGNIQASVIQFGRPLMSSVDMTSPQKKMLHKTAAKSSKTKPVASKSKFSYQQKAIVHNSKLLQELWQNSYHLPLFEFPITCTGGTGICNMCSAATPNTWGFPVNLQLYWDSTMGATDSSLGFNIVMSFDTLSLGNYGSGMYESMIDFFENNNQYPQSYVITDKNLLNPLGITNRGGFSLLGGNIVKLNILAKGKRPANQQINVVFWHQFPTNKGGFNQLPSKFQLPQAITNQFYPVTPIKKSNLVWGGYWGAPPTDYSNAPWGQKGMQNGGIACVSNLLGGFPVYIQFFVDSSLYVTGFPESIYSFWLTFDTLSLNKYNLNNGIFNYAISNFINSVGTAGPQGGLIQMYAYTFLQDPIISTLNGPSIDTFGLAIQEIDTFNIQNPDGSGNVQISMKFTNWNPSPASYYPIPCLSCSGGADRYIKAMAKRKPVKKVPATKKQ
jgi:hypothetical protein